MAEINLVTGYRGEAHVSAVDQRAFNASVCGDDDFIIKGLGQEFKATVMTTNSVRIYSGDGMMQGTHFRIANDEYVDVAIENGVSGYKRYDLIVAEYTKDTSTNVEKVEIKCIKGAATTGTPSDPDVSTGDVLNGDAVLHDMVLWRIPVTDLTVGTPVQVATVRYSTLNTSLSDTLDALRADIAAIQNVLADGAGAHNSIYRGKYLGTAVTDEQYAAISNGTFTDLYIGDYWTINSVTYRIAAFDYYYNCGDTNCTTHHVVLVPDSCLYNAQMNSSNTTKGGYVGSKMYTANLETAKTIIKEAFSGHVLSHRIYLTNAITNGYASGGLWCDSEVDLMNENMVYGSAIFRPQNYLGATIPNSFTVERSQLPLFAHAPRIISAGIVWWLRDVVSASMFATVNNDGSANSLLANYSRGVRPAFCIS